MAGGRPSIYESTVKDKLYLVEQWAEAGLSNEQIAENLGIAAGTLYEWKKMYPEFDESLCKSKEIADRAVENALYKKCVGYQKQEQRVTKDGDVIDIEVEIDPDVTAIKYWLNNRRGDKWKEKAENTVKIDGDLPSDQLKEKLDSLMKEYQNLESR